MQDTDTFTVISGLTAAILIVLFRALSACRIDLDNPDVQERVLLHAAELATFLVLMDRNADKPDISEVIINDKWW